MAFGLVNRTPKGDRFFWNIDTKVGLRSPNQPLDVQLVQFGYFAVLRSPVNQGRLSPEETDAFSKIALGTPCSGQEDDPLVRAIRAHEASRGGTQDGVVSPLSQGHVIYSDAQGQHALILVALNNSMKDILGDQYPRIDKHDQCPADLKALVGSYFGK